MTKQARNSPISDAIEDKFHSTFLIFFLCMMTIKKYDVQYADMNYLLIVHF